MSERKCRECDEFVKVYGGRNGGGRPCKSDTTPNRRVVYALDYACDNITIDGKSLKEQQPEAEPGANA